MSERERLECLRYDRSWRLVLLLVSNIRAHSRRALFFSESHQRSSRLRAPHLALRRNIHASEQFTQMSLQNATYGITRLLGESEEHFFDRGRLFRWRPPRQPQVCAADVRQGKEQRHACLRSWPERALHGLGTCPDGEADVVRYPMDAFNRSIFDQPLCMSRLRRLSPGCLVYSVGIGGDARWEQWMAHTYGCEVHTFDPTIRLRAAHARRASTYGVEEELLPSSAPMPGRVHFHFHGLGTSVASDERLYGQINSSVLLPLAEVIRRLNHTHRALDVLKLDCEGCEWAVLGDAASPVPRAVRRSVGMLLLEMHLADSMVPPAGEQYTTLWRNLLGVHHGSWGGLRIAYRHDNVGSYKGPYASGRVPAEVVALGAPSGQCCVEYILVRPEVLPSAAWNIS